jgi:hypothetical protein
VKLLFVLAAMLLAGGVSAQQAASEPRPVAKASVAAAKADTRNQLKLSGEISVDGSIVSAPRLMVANNEMFKMTIGKKIALGKDGGSAEVTDTVDNERPSFMLECTPVAAGDEWSASCDLVLQWSKDGRQFDRKMVTALKSRLGQRAEAVEKFADTHEVKLALTVARNE